MKKIIILLIVLLIFLGFTPYDELNSLAVVDTLGIEFKDNKYSLYLNVINDDNKVYNVKGDSLGEVFLKAKNIDNKKTYYNHLEVVVLNTNIIDNKTLNFFKDEFTAIDYLVLGTEDSLEELFKNYHKRNDYKSFINKERNESASIINVTFKEFLSSSLDDIKDASIPLISYKNNLRSEGIYIPSSKIILGRSLARANYLINNKIDAFNTKVQLNNDYYEVNVYDLKPRISYKNNTINIKVEGKIDSPDSDDLTELKKIVIKDLKDNIFELVNNERKNNYNISNVINYIYLKTRNANYSPYNKADISININLKEEDKNNYG